MEWLTDANIKIRDGVSQLASGIGLAGQASEIKNLVNQVKLSKEDMLAGAFDRIFLLSAISYA